MNVERHAEATEVMVRWAVHDGVARLEVTDNGSGFELGTGGRRALRPCGHAGTCRCNRRALAIESRPGRGTKVAVELVLSGQQASERRTA